MRWLVLLSAAACAAWVGATCAFAQDVAAFGRSEDQIPPYHTHLDRRHGHDHVYPDRGAIVRDLPSGSTIVNYAGISYRFEGGIWFEPRGPAYVVVAPPIGLIVPVLPAFATAVHEGETSYFYANDVYYRARPDLGGYEVVNDPQDTAAAAPEGHAAEHAATSQNGGAAPEGRAVTSPVTPVTPGTPGTPEVRGTPTVSSHPAIEAKQAPTPAPAAPVRASAAPPPTPSSPSASSAPSNPTRLSLLPQNGQSADDQARDRYACYRFAVAQSGFDPLSAQGNAAEADAGKRRSEYERAQAACLEGRGYRLR